MGKQDKEKKNLRRMIIGCILFAASFVLLYISKKSEGMAQWYTQHIYPVIVSVIGRISGIFPFSVAEIALYLAAALLVILGVRLIFRLIRRKAGLLDAGGFLSGLFMAAAVLFFIYTINCGINYNRESFANSTGIHTDSYTKEDLVKVCTLLTRDINERSKDVERDRNGVMILTVDVDKEAVEAMEKLGKEYPELSGYYPRPKGLLIPWILSIQNLTGVYSPFTVEANYNSGIVDYNIPFTACHELSHLRGFMQEEEANFIAWLACSSSGQEEFRYSASMMGWIYCMSLLRSMDEESWKPVREQLSPQAEADLKANDRYWSRYEGKAAEVANRINDTYLKANGQQDGVESYDRMADMIVAYYLLGKES